MTSPMWMSSSKPLMTYKFIPTGGVTSAISMLTVNTIAYQMGSILNLKRIGATSGTVSRMIETVSRMHPKNSIKIFIATMNMKADKLPFDDEGRERLGNLDQGQHSAEQDGAGDDQCDHARGAHRLQADVGRSRSRNVR